jgi:hypothetical protein
VAAALARVIAILAATLPATEDSTNTIIFVALTTIIIVAVLAADLALVISMEIIRIIKPGPSLRMAQISRMARALFQLRCSDGFLLDHDKNLNPKLRR